MKLDPIRSYSFYDPPKSFQGKTMALMDKIRLIAKDDPIIPVFIGF